MRALRPERLELIDALVAETALGGITAGLLEKDEHLTDALRALFALSLDGMSFAFCGGTSLSKAHGLIERMSEDADLKIVLAAQTLPLSRTQLRKRLSELKNTVSETLAGIGLVEDKSRTRALNKNHYFCSEWSYARQYGSVAGLLQHDWDSALVRHIYDVHCAQVRLPAIVATASQAFAELVAGDQKEFGGQFPDFAAAALPVLSGALRQAGASTKIQAEYTQNLLPLIYGRGTPGFAEAFAGFEAVALLATLERPSHSGSVGKSATLTTGV